jgi:hypothetical protein
MPKSKMNGTRVVILVLMIFLSILLLSFSVMLLKEYVIEDKPTKARLVVDEVYFVDKEDANGKTKLEVFVFVTNEGDLDCKSHIRGFAIDKDTNIAQDDTDTEDVKIEGQTTVESKLTFEIPESGRYRVELLVFKDKKITVTGQGHVDLVVGGSSGSDYRTTEGDDDSEKDDGASIPFIGPAGIIVVLIVSIFIFRRWRK